LLVEWQYGLGRVIAWTSDASNRWSAAWLNGDQQFQPFWAQVVKRTIRPPEDPNRQVSASVAGSQATVQLDALSGPEGTTERQYVNFLPVSAAVVDPRGVPLQIQLPQVAPGEYRASLPVGSDGVYTLQVTETTADGSQTTQSSGFVVPYSPEYRDLATNDALLGALAAASGGQVIQTSDQAFAHDLPSVGAPRPIWPQLLGLLALLLVADVAVRRMRFSALDVRSGYRAVRERLGYLEEAGPRPSRRAAPAIIAATPFVSVASGERSVRAEPVSPASASSRSRQLLAAKRRARR
jgi:hypothetical protein